MQILNKANLAILILVLVPGLLFPQVQLKRNVISSLGGSSKIDNQVYISYTGGQSPQAGLIQDSEYLRQGFEQPKEMNECGILNNFVVEEVTTECGNYYSFEYTGTTDVDYQYQWDFGAFGLPRYSSSQNIFDITFSQEGSFIVSLVVTNTEGCSEGASKYISVQNTALGAKMDIDDLDCEDDSYDITIVPFNGDEPYRILWEDASSQFEKSNLAVGSYTYTVTDVNDCEIVNTIEIEYSNPMLGLAGVVENANCDTSVLGSIELIVEGGIPPITATWEDGNNAMMRSDLLPGVYNVELLDSRGCSIEDSYTVKAICLTVDDLPNTFTPNGDGKNETWNVPNIEDYPNNTLEIYNRWGSIIYEAAPYMNQWDGTNSEKEELPMGAYYYVLEFNDNENNRINGSVTILR